MAFGSLTTSLVTTRTSVETFTPVLGVVHASAASVAHVMSMVTWQSGNTGIGTLNLYTSLGSGVFSATTQWDTIPLLSFSIASNSVQSQQLSFAVSGGYAWRLGINNSSNSTIALQVGYRID